MQEAFSRSAMLIGEDRVETIARKRVAVFGLGGVGGAAAEALARSGVGMLDLVDGDVVTASNLNRQLPALVDTIGLAKAHVMAQRARQINPGITVRGVERFYTPDTADSMPIEDYDCVLDCVDMVTAKLLLARMCAAQSIPLISAMGAGNRLDPTQVRVADISGTSMCPLARVMRKRLKTLGVEKLTVAWSPEQPMRPLEQLTVNGRHPPASMMFVPAAMGLAMASWAVRTLCGLSETNL